MDMNDSDLSAFIVLALEHQKEAVLNVTGWSMGCTLGPASTVVIRPLRRHPRLGDVVVVKTKREFMAHRVISRSGSRITTKGDNCIAADAPSEKEQLIGIVAGVVTDGGMHVPWHWRQPAAMIAAIFSRLEAQGPQLVKRVLIRLHRFWQARIMWRFMKPEHREAFKDGE